MSFLRKQESRVLMPPKSPHRLRLRLRRPLAGQGDAGGFIWLKCYQTRTYPLRPNEVLSEYQV